MKNLTARLEENRELNREEINEAADLLLKEDGDADDKVAFLSALAEKGETPAEITGFVEAFLEHAVDPGLDPASVTGPLIDVCGTGGDRLDLFNVSTAAVFVIAGAGGVVVKHGNRGITSKSGGADVLEALGIRIDLPPDRFVAGVQRIGAGFLFAPQYHPAFKAVAPVRKKLAEQGKRTIFNLLGPLLNPARPDYQLVGLFDESLPPVFSEILQRLGRQCAWAIHGKVEDETGPKGMDEFSTLGETRVCETKAGVTREFTVTPGELGLETPTLEDLKGGDAGVNAGILEGILSGEIRGAKRDIVTLNAAAALTVAGLAEDLPRGLELAEASIDQGAARDRLERWRIFSRNQPT